MPGGRSMKKGKKGVHGPKGAEGRKKKEEPNMANLLDSEAPEGAIDFEKLVKTEYMKRQREYRLMENTRHVLAGAGNALSKQERLVELLRKESMDIDTDLYNADSNAWEMVDLTSGNTILTIVENIDKALISRDFCITNIREIESHVDKITRILIAQRLKVQAIYGRSMTVPQADRRKRVLENRLYLATTRYDTKLSGNKALREEINMMLKLRGLFYQRHLAMKKQLEKIRTNMTEVVYVATHTYEQRDELVTSIRNIRDKHDKDTRSHVLEIKEFHRILHNDAKVRDFNVLKNRERIMLESGIQRELRRKMAYNEELEATLNFFAASFRKALRMSNYDSLESFIKHYKETEQTNFSRFLAIADVNHEVSILLRENEEIAIDIDERFVAFKELEEFQDKITTQLLETLEKKKDELAQVSRFREITEQNIGEVLEAMDSLIKETGCSDQAILRLLGNDSSEFRVTPRNVLLCMHSVETRGRDLVMEKHQHDIRKAVEFDGIPLQRATAVKQAMVPKGSKRAGGPYVPEVIVAGRLDGEDEGEEEDRGSHIFSADEFRLKVIAKMQLKRELQARTSLENISMPGGHDERASNVSSTRTIFPN